MTSSSRTWISHFSSTSWVWMFLIAPSSPSEIPAEIPVAGNCAVNWEQFSDSLAHLCSNPGATSQIFLNFRVTSMGYLPSSSPAWGLCSMHSNPLFFGSKLCLLSEHFLGRDFRLPEAARVSFNKNLHWLLIHVLLAKSH